jgi:hypothetical protein
MGKGFPTVLNTSTFLAYTCARRIDLHNFYPSHVVSNSMPPTFTRTVQAFCFFASGRSSSLVRFRTKGIEQDGTAKYLETRTHMLRRNGVMVVIQDGEDGAREWWMRVVDARGGAASFCFAPRHALV